LVMVILCCSLGCLWFWAGKVFNIRLKSQLPPLQ
jgi:hypothetical protein